MATLKVTQIKSANSVKKNQRETLRTLRLTDGLSVSIITVGDGLAVAVKR